MAELEDQGIQRKMEVLNSLDAKGNTAVYIRGLLSIPFPHLLLVHQRLTCVWIRYHAPDGLCD